MIRSRTSRAGTFPRAGVSGPGSKGCRRWNQPERLQDASGSRGAATRSDDRGHARHRASVGPEGAADRPCSGRPGHRRAHHQATHERDHRLEREGDLRRSDAEHSCAVQGSSSLIGSDYYLNFLDGMRWLGSLSRPVSRTSLACAVRRRRLATRIRCALTDEARGKVVVGGTTFLFQFVAPPPPQPRPQLPLAVKVGLASQIDWNLDRS